MELELIPETKEILKKYRKYQRKNSIETFTNSYKIATPTAIA